MALVPTGIRVCAAAAPVLLLPYGVFRPIDGRDGEHGPGLARNVGHTLLFVGFVLLGVLIVGLHRLVRGAAGRTRLAAHAAAAAGSFGVGCFPWVILGDPFADLGDAAPLPKALEPVEPVGSLLPPAGAGLDERSGSGGGTGPHRIATGGGPGAEGKEGDGLRAGRRDYRSASVS
ncbi:MULTISPECIES: hypothetical protein [Streptomyces]|uniref:Uncharacterized protein n=1 Tax=Streptomyces fimbriatus TaxID=68197 RepID=A0ABW0DEP6_STRFI